jgi:hypothetical protein
MCLIDTIFVSTDPADFIMALGVPVGISQHFGSPASRPEAAAEKL